MIKYILLMVLNSRYLGLYLSIYTLVTFFFTISLYMQPLNFTALTFVLVISILTSLFVCNEVLLQESGHNVHNYISYIESENRSYFIHTSAIYFITLAISLSLFIILNIVFFENLILSIQLSYMAIFAIFEFCYVYFLQYCMHVFDNTFVRRLTISSVSLICVLSLITKSIITFLTVVSLCGLFMAATVINRKLVYELRKEEEYKK